MGLEEKVNSLIDLEEALAMIKRHRKIVKTEQKGHKRCREARPIVEKE